MAFENFRLTETSPAAQSKVAGVNTITGLTKYDRLVLHAKLTQATGGTLDVYLQGFDALLNEWYDWAHFPQLAAGSTVFRYAVACEASAVSPFITVVGAGVLPALAANTIVSPHPGDIIRFCFDAGASTSAGASQIVTVQAQRKRR